MSALPLLDGLEAGTRELLELCGRIAQERGEHAYLVGGPVRDLLLGRDFEDTDVVVVGDGMAVAQTLARQRQGRLTRFHAFRTARVDLPEKRHVDVATARRETYERPGSLPVVDPGELADDLARRDFTINTLALSLAPDRFGELVDPFDGIADIEAGRIRILHERSFVDDPTRLLRALRFVVRFDYELDDMTGRSFEAAVQGRYVEELSGARLRRELARNLAEAPVDGPVALQEHGLLTSVHPRLRVDREALAGVGDAAAAAGIGEAERWPLVLAVLAHELSPQERQALARRLRLSRDDRAALVDSGAPWERALRVLGADGSRSVAAEALDDVAPAALAVRLALLRAQEDPLAARLEGYLRDDRHVRSTLDGAALQALGFEPGPAMGEALRRLRAARLDGRISTPEEERALAADLLSQGAN